MGAGAPMTSGPEALAQEEHSESRARPLRPTMKAGAAPPGQAKDEDSGEAAGGRGKCDAGRDAENAQGDAENAQGDAESSRPHDKKTSQEIEDQYLDGEEYRVSLFCDAKNTENADTLCGGDGCSACSSNWWRGDFRRTHCCIACFRGGLTRTDYYTIAGLVVLFVSVVLWGVLVFVTEPDTWIRVRAVNANATAEAKLTNSTAELLQFHPDSKRIGPVLSMVTLTLLFTVAPSSSTFRRFDPSSLASTRTCSWNLSLQRCCTRASRVRVASMAGRSSQHDVAGHPALLPPLSVCGHVWHRALQMARRQVASWIEL